MTMESHCSHFLDRCHLYRLDDVELLVADGMSVHAPGQVCRPLPPDEDVHRVSSAGDAAVGR